jgi:hypothetical protein
MNNKKDFLMAGKAGFVLGAMLLVSLTAPLTYADGLQVGVTVDPTLAVMAQDNYVYYPSYGVYYNSHRNQYAYQEHGAWVSRAAPHGVSVDMLRASPSVKMDFHDSPANHHAAMVQKYPKNWAPSRSNDAQSRSNDGRKDDDHGQK